MRQKVIFIRIIILTVLIFSNCAKKADFPVLKGPYLGQKPSGMTPEIFAPSIVTSGMNESSLVFSPDHSELYYDMTNHTHQFTAIVCMRRLGGVWQKHEVAPFSGKFEDSSPFISWDNQRLFYCSNRPFKEDHDMQDFDLWFVERGDNGWGDPINLGPQVNSDQVDVNPCITEKGVLYFASNRDGGRGGHDIYKSLPIDGKFQTPVNLGEPINTSDFESSPYVSSDESYIIFNVFAGKDSDRRSGLHISFKTQDGTWSNPVYLGDTINRDKPGMFAYVSPDGKYLFFTSQYVPYLPYTGDAVNYTQLKEMLNNPPNGSLDIYWVDAKIIEDFKPDELK